MIGKLYQDILNEKQNLSLKNLMNDLEEKIQEFINNLITDLRKKVEPLLSQLQNTIKGKDKYTISSALASVFRTLSEVIEVVDQFLQDHPETKEASGMIIGLLNINCSALKIVISVLEVTQAQLKDENYESSCKKELGNVLNSCKKLLENFVKKDKNVADKKNTSAKINESIELIVKSADSLKNPVSKLNLLLALQKCVKLITSTAQHIHDAALSKVTPSFAATIKQNKLNNTNKGKCLQ